VITTTVDRVSPEVAVVALDGELDASNFQDVIALGNRLYADGVRRLVLDLGDLTYIASSGIVALHSLVLTFRGLAPLDTEAGWGAIHAASLNTEASDEVRLVSPRPNIERILQRTGLSGVLRIHPDRPSALA
jgi:anti-anti-sigma regulatory factor